MVTRKSPAKATKAATSAPKPASRERKRAVAKPVEPPAPAKRSKAAAALPVAPAAPSAEERYRAIAHAAYLRAEQRGFEPGREIDDWLAAEAEYEAALKASAQAPGG